MIDFSGMATSDELIVLGGHLEPLRSAASISHKNGSLLAHLIGVWRVLCAGGASPEIARAGLIHSVYSTQFFRTGLFESDERRRIARIYGERPEYIAWLFCRIDRSLLWEARPQQGFFEEANAVDHETRAEIGIDADTANDLFMIECANFIDQGYPDRWIGTYHAWALSLTSRGVGLDFALDGLQFPLSEESEAAAIKHYLPDNGTAAGFEELKSAAINNPLAAEPHILSASIAAVEGRYIDARNDLARARDRLPIFGASWDKRLSWSEWVAVANALSCSIEELKSPSLNGEPSNPHAVRDWAISEYLK